MTSRLKRLAGSVATSFRRRPPATQSAPVFPRYANLERLVRQERCRRIMEIGTHDGANAERLIRIAQRVHASNDVEYFGFDLFEEITAQKVRDEFALQPPAEAVVRERLRATGARIELFRGDSRITLPAAKAVIGIVDFIFIDGGHSQETTRSDWENAQDHIGPRTVAVIDDYFENEELEVREFGSQVLVESLDPASWQVRLLDPLDTFEHPWGVLRTRMVEVRRR